MGEAVAENLTNNIVSMNTVLDQVGAQPQCCRQARFLVK